MNANEFNYFYNKICDKNVVVVRVLNKDILFAKENMIWNGYGLNLTTYELVNKLIELNRHNEVKIVG